MHRPRRSTTLAALAFVAIPVVACANDDPTNETSTDSGRSSGPIVTAGRTTASESITPSTTAAATESSTAPRDTGDDTASTRITLPDDGSLQPVAGGNFRFALIADVDGLNPTSSALTASSGLIMANAVFDTLAAYAADGSAVPYLAESFTPSVDFSSWNVTLRPGVTFHDGTPLDAAAVQLNFESQRANALIGLAVRPFYPDTNATEVVDALTLRFNLLNPNRYWPYVMAGQQGMMASPAWIEAALADPTLNQRPVGTGPFVFDSRSEDSVTRFVRNDDWWNGRAYLDSLEFLPVPDAATRNDFLLTGEVDGIHTTEPSSILELRGESAISLALDDSGAETFIHVNTSSAPFDDLRARQAFAWATPRNDYLALIGLNTERAANGRFVPESPYADPTVVQPTDDPARAIALAAEYCADFPANCNDGKINMEYQWPGPDVVNSRIADLMIDAWSVAFNVTRDELLQDEHIQQTALGQFNAGVFQGFAAVDPVTDVVWISCGSIGAISLNFPRLCDPAIDEALQAAAVAEDPGERAARYQETERLLNASFARVYLTHALVADAFTSDVRGVCNRINPEGVPLLCTTGNVFWHSSTWIA